MRIPTGVPSCRSPCQLALLTLGLGFFAPGNIGAQVKCSLGRQPSVNYLGVCIGQKNVPVRVELEPGASSSGLWRGRTSDTTGYTVLVAIDTTAHVYREFRGWFRLVEFKQERDSLWYRFAQDSLVRPTDQDLQVLRSARAYLADSIRLSHADDGDVEKVAAQFYEKPELARGGYCNTGSRRTLVCALYHAQIEVTGEYWWGSPAMNMIRAAIMVEDTPRLRHPLMQFNGAATTTIKDVQRVIEVAIGYAKERRSCSLQYWVWGDQPCRER